MKSHHELTLETLKGCGKNIQGNYGCNYNDRKCGSRNRLCPICKAKAQTLIDAGKDELKFLNGYKKQMEKNGTFVSGMIFSNYNINERITQLSQDIKLLEDALK